MGPWDVQVPSRARESHPMEAAFWALAHFAAEACISCGKAHSAGAHEQVGHVGAATSKPP